MSRQVNTGLCSFGMSGLVFHAAFLQAHPGFNLYAVVERSEKKAASVYPGIISYDAVDDLLADEHIELVIVNTPNYTHYEFAKKALLAGKHVLVEKSFTVTVHEAEELIALAKNENLVLSVFQNRRYDSDFKTVKEIVKSGALGKIVEAEFRFERYKPGLSPKKHKETLVPGSGLLHDLGPHIIDQALHLFGMPGSVAGFLKITRPESIVNDHVDIMLFYHDKTIRLKSSLLVKEAMPAYSVHGTNGSFLKQRADIQEDMLKQGARPGGADWGCESPEKPGILNITREGKEERVSIHSEKGNYMEFYDGLYAAIENGQPLPVTARDGLHVMRIIEAALDSNISGRIIDL